MRSSGACIANMSGFEFSVHTTAQIAAQCQSFLDNVIASFDGV
jgi:hypothetical protein